MNTKDEIIDVIEGRFRGPLPPPVLLTQTGTTDLMDLCGAEWPDAHYNVDKMGNDLSPSSRLTMEPEASEADVGSLLLATPSFWILGHFNILWTP